MNTIEYYINNIQTFSKEHYIKIEKSEIEDLYNFYIKYHLEFDDFLNHNCEDCENCIMCFKCINCTGCVMCNNCDDCDYCVECDNSTECKNCINCKWYKYYEKQEKYIAYESAYINDEERYTLNVLDTQGKTILKNVDILEYYIKNNVYTNATYYIKGNVHINIEYYGAICCENCKDCVSITLCENCNDCVCCYEIKSCCMCRYIENKENECYCYNYIFRQSIINNITFTKISIIEPQKEIKKFKTLEEVNKYIHETFSSEEVLANSEPILDLKFGLICIDGKDDEVPSVVEKYLTYKDMDFKSEYFKGEYFKSEC